LILRSDGQFYLHSHFSNITKDGHVIISSGDLATIESMVSKYADISCVVGHNLPSIIRGQRLLHNTTTESEPSVCAARHPQI
jgi:hypothetical protein